MQTASGMPASTASITADLVNLAGTKMTVTSAPVASTASATEPNTGTWTSPSNVTLWPPLPGVTPPTMSVPDASMRCVCLRPSEPVMPWTTTLLSLVKKIAMRYRSLLRGGELGRLAGGTVHGVHEGDEGVGGLGEDPPALHDVVAVQPDDERLGRLVAEDLQRVHDAVGDRVARGDPAEHVDEHALDLRVAQDDVQTVGHDLGRGAAADVQEVGRLDPARLLAGVRDDVQGAHDEPGAVADDPYLAVQLDVVEALLLRGCLKRVGGGLVLELLVAGVPEAGVVVERDLAVDGDDRAVLGLHQRVNLDQGGVLVAVHVPEALHDAGDLVLDVVVEARRVDDLAGLGLVDPDDRVDLDPGQRVRALDGELLDLHPALLAGHREVAAVGPVEQHREVVLLGDLGPLGHHHPVHGVALDVHAEDVRGAGGGLVGAVRELHAAGLATASGLDLRLDDDRAAAQPLGARAGLLRRLRDRRLEHGDPVLGEQVACLVLEQVHGASSSPSDTTVAGSSAGCRRLSWVVVEAHRRRTSGAAASLDPGGLGPATECRVPGVPKPHLCADMRLH